MSEGQRSKEDLVARIRKILAKTESAGCTAEAHAHLYKKDGTVKRSGASRFTEVTGSASVFAAGQQAGRSLNLHRSIGGGGPKHKGLPGS